MWDPGTLASWEGLALSPKGGDGTHTYTHTPLTDVTCGRSGPLGVFWAPLEAGSCSSVRQGTVISLIQERDMGLRLAPHPPDLLISSDPFVIKGEAGPKRLINLSKITRATAWPRPSYLGVNPAQQRSSG